MICLVLDIETWLLRYDKIKSPYLLCSMLYNTGLAKVLKMALLERVLSSAFATR